MRYKSIFLLIPMLLLSSLACADEFNLGKLVITPTKYKIRLGDSTVSASVSDEEDFEAGQFYDVSEPLDRINSVRIERYGSQGQQSSAVIRGVTGSGILVLIDGVPYNAPSTGSADLSQVPLSRVKQIELVRGPYSSLYGSNAVGGVINIITKDIPEKETSRISYSAGSWNTHNLTAEFGAPLENFGFNLMANYQTTEGHRKHSDYDALDLEAKLKFKIAEDIDYTLQSTNYIDETEHPGVRPAESILNRTLSQQILGNADIASNEDYSTIYKTRLNSLLNIGNFSFQQYYIYWNSDDHRESINISGERLVDQDVYKTYMYGMELKLVQPIKDTNVLTLGSSIYRNVFDVETRQTNDTTGSATLNGWDPVRREWSIFAENELELYPLTINVGLRHDKPSDFPDRWSPKISGLLDLGHDAKLRAAYGRAYRAPTLNDLYWPDFGNPNLLPEKTEGFEFGIEKLFKKSALVKLTYFMQRTKDRIAWAPNNAGNWVPSNINSSSTKGIELETSFVLFKNIEASLDYTYLDAEEKITTGGQEYRRKANFIPAHKIGAGLSWKNPLDLKGFAVNSFITYVSDRRFFFTPSTKSTESPYMVCDIKFLYNPNKNTRYYLAVNNLFNEKYNKFGGTSADRGYPQPGISVTAGVDISY